MEADEVKAIRASYGLSQRAFAERMELYGRYPVSWRTIQDWEQSRRAPNEQNEATLIAMKKAGESK